MLFSSLAIRHIRSNEKKMLNPNPQGHLIPITVFYFTKNDHPCSIKIPGKAYIFIANFKHSRARK